MFTFVTTLIVVVACRDAVADSHSFGKCPHVEPQHDFDMEKMLGTWYAVQKTATNVPCLEYNITRKEDHPGHYLLVETFPSSKLSKLVGLGHEHQVTGELRVIDPAVPAVMNLKVPLDIGSYKFTVFMTDYGNYAAVLSCKTYPLTFSRLIKWSAMILSRTPTLDIGSVERIRTRMSAYNVNPFTLSIIDHEHCAHGERGVVIQAVADGVDKFKDLMKAGAEEIARRVNDSAFSKAIDEVNGGLYTIFENPDVYVQNKSEDGHDEQPKSSYLES